MSQNNYPLDDPERVQLLQELIDRQLEQILPTRQNPNRQISIRRNSYAENLAVGQNRTQQGDFFPAADGIQIIDLDSNRDQIKQTTWGLR